MDIINKIDEAVKKPSFEEYFFDKKKYKSLYKEFERNYDNYAADLGQDFLDDDNYYPQDEDEYGMEVEPIEAYENYAHTTGYQAEYDSAKDLILNHKRKYDYKSGDEDDNNEYVEMLIDYMGYSTSFGAKGKRKEYYWKLAEKG